MNENPTDANLETLLGQLFDPGNLLVNMVGGVTVELVIFYLIAQILPPKNKRLYVIVLVVALVTLMFFKPIMSNVARLLFLLAHVAIPLFMLQGPFVARMIVGLLNIVTMLAGEIAGVTAWVALTGLPTMDNDLIVENLPAYFVGFLLIDVPVTGILLIGMGKLINKYLLPKPQRKTDKRQACSLSNEDTQRAPRWSARVLWFPALQLALVCVLIFMSMHFAQGNPERMTVAGLLVAFGCIVDVLLILQIARSLEHAKESARIESLNQSISSCMQEAEPLQGLLADTARLRHDLRNHKLVMEQLCAKGQSAQAQAYLDALALEMPPLPKDPIDRNAGNPPANPASPGLPPN